MAKKGSEFDHAFWRAHLIIPLALFAVLAGVLNAGQIDLAVADWLYALEGGRWAMRHSVLFSDILHDGVAGLMKALALLVLALALAAQLSERLRPYRWTLWYLALCMPLSALLVSIGKHITHVDCPWDLLRYGGDRPYLGLFEPPPDGHAPGKCFPSGHASSGYALLALYFACLRHGSHWRWRGLFVGLGCGLLLGLAQQIRGAHFLSHDLWALAVCWCNSLVCHRLLFRTAYRRAWAVRPGAWPERQA